MFKESLCVDCGGKVLSEHRLKKRCPSCQDIHRVRQYSAAKTAKRRLLREQAKMNKMNQAASVGENNTADIRSDAISKDTNYTDDIHEKQSLQKASD
jgi:reverse gyrase